VPAAGLYTSTDATPFPGAMTTASPLPASPWRRLAAACYDGLLLLAIWTVTLLTSLFVHKLLGAARNDHANSLALFLGGMAFFGWSWTHGGQTLGMRSWHLQLRREDAAAVRWPVAALRYALMLASWLMALTLLVLPLLPAAVSAAVPHRFEVLAGCAALTALSMLAPLLDGRRRTWYDRLTSTEVVRLPKENREG
jgi:uncharacterized RDD family membrane protein YckC